MEKTEKDLQELKEKVKEISKELEDLSEEELAHNGLFGPLFSFG